ncbi:MAG: hypothetical protein AAGD06_24825, partial [Acidobacteriota bacterium]
MTAWVDGQALATSVAEDLGDGPAYRLDVPGDLPETPEDEGATEGQTVTFRVDGADTGLTATWHGGTYARLDLEAPAGADLGIAVDDGREDWPAGETTTYSITVTNGDVVAATGVVVTATLPSDGTGSVTVVDAGGASIADGVATWPAFDLGAGETATWTLSLALASTVPADLLTA